MARTFAKKFYNSKQWKECRKGYIEHRQSVDGGLCESCGQVTGNLGWIVHHTVWLTPDNITDPMVALNASKLRYDCQICHNQEKENEEQEKKRYVFGVNGEVILIPPKSDEE